MLSLLAEDIGCIYKHADEPRGSYTNTRRKKKKEIRKKCTTQLNPAGDPPISIFWMLSCCLTLRLRLLLYFLASAWLFIVVCSAERKTRESIYISFYFLLRKHVGKKKKLFSFLSTLFLFFFFFYNIGDKNSHDSLDDGYNI